MYIANNGEKAVDWFYLCCVGSYIAGDVFVEFFGPDREAAIRSGVRHVKELGKDNGPKLVLLTGERDPGWACGDKEGNYVEVRRHHLSGGHSFRDDNDRHDALFPQEKTMFDNGWGRDRPYK